MEIKEKSILNNVLLSIFTLNIYNVFWIYTLFKEYNYINYKKKYMPFQSIYSIRLFIPLAFLMPIFYVPIFYKLYSVEEKNSRLENSKSKIYISIFALLLVVRYFIDLSEENILSMQLLIISIICQLYQLILIINLQHKLNNFVKSINNKGEIKDE